jgi:hypothetical protein
VNWWQWVQGQCRVDSAALRKEFNDSVGFEMPEGWSHSRKRSGGCSVVKMEVFKATHDGLDWASNLVTREAMSHNFSMDCILLVREDKSDKGCIA